MNEIAISVTNKIAETTFDEVVSFNSNYRLKFSFDEEWDAFPSRVAVVLWGDGAAERAFTGTECEMPPIASADAQSALIGVYSCKEGSRVASSFVRVRCVAGAHEQPPAKPFASLGEQMLSFLNEKDWSVFEDKIEEGVYSAVRVDPMGFVTEGYRIMEIGEEGQSEPSEKLAAGGVFFRLNEGVYTPCYFDGESLQPLKLTAEAKGHTLSVGEKKYDGSADVSVGAEDLGLAAVATSGSYNDLLDKPEPGSGSGAVSSVNGQTGDVTISKFDLGLAEVALSGSFTDLKDVPQRVDSVNGEKGDVTVSAESLGLAAVATSGNFADLVGMPETTVFSVNGKSGEVELTKEDLGLGSLAERDLVATEFLEDNCVTRNKIKRHTINNECLEDDCIYLRNLHRPCVGTDHLEYNAVTGMKINPEAFEAGENVSIFKDPFTGKINFSAHLDASVTSVNGKQGEVVLDRETLGLSELAYSGDYKDLKGAPESGVYSVNGQTGTVVIDQESLGLADIAFSGSFRDLTDAPESGVLSVNGDTGNVTVSAETLGLSAVATSGKFEDLEEKPQIVNSINGQSGEVTIDKELFGFGALASLDKVTTAELEDGCVTPAKIKRYGITNSCLEDGCISTRTLVKDAVATDRIAYGAVTGYKINEAAIQAGDNVSIEREWGTGNFIISAKMTMGVNTVNGQAGDVIVDKASLGLNYVTSERQMPLAGDTRNGADFNELFPNGFYHIAGTETEACTHFPTSAQNVSGNDCSWFLLVMSASDNAHCTQVAFSARSDAAVRIRTFQSGEWSDWLNLFA